LSSWLTRIAACYGMEVRELLEHDLGGEQPDDLDLAPPEPLLAELSRRGGIGLDQLRCMSLRGWTPWLLDSLDDQTPMALETYVFQFSILLPKHKRKTRSAPCWRAWWPSQPMARACPLCLGDPADHALLLAWKLPLMLSCPQHGCWLEPYWGVPGRFIGWEHGEPSPRKTNAAITAMDRRTWQALTMGHVDLPRRAIHAGVWFRFVRTLLDELNTPLSQCGPYAGNLRAVWERCGHPLRAGQSLWRPYEALPSAVQLQMLEAAATAMDMIESRVVVPDGEQGILFLPEPQGDFTDGIPMVKPVREAISSWQGVVDAVNDVVTEAKRSPEVARSLFAFASHGCRDAGSLTRLRVTFTEVGIPPEYLSDYDPDRPFACHSQNDGLSDKF